MPVSDVQATCISITLRGQNLCVTFPGGQTVCVSTDFLNPSDWQLARNLLARAEAALAPYRPTFDLITALTALYKCVVKIPGIIPTSVGDFAETPAKVAEVAQCLTDLKSQINALLAQLPPFTIPLLILGLLDAFILLLEGMKAQVTAIVNAQIRAINAATKASRVGSLSLQAAVDCKALQISAQIGNLNSSLGPVNSFITALGAVLNLVPGLSDVFNLQAIPPIDDVSGTEPVLSDVLAPIDAVISTLTQIRAPLLQFKQAADAGLNAILL